MSTPSETTPEVQNPLGAEEIELDGSTAGDHGARAADEEEGEGVVDIYKFQRGCAMSSTLNGGECLIFPTILNRATNNFRPAVSRVLLGCMQQTLRHNIQIRTT